MTDKKQNDKINWIIIGSAIIIFVCGTMYFTVPSATGLSVEELGQRGDMFGGLTSLFTGLAFVGLVSTLIMQRKDLDIQRKSFNVQSKELDQTRALVAAQTEQMKLQNQQIQKQMFEATFFQMLDVLNKYIDTLEWPKTMENGKKATARGVFIELEILMQNEWKRALPMPVSEASPAEDRARNLISRYAISVLGNMTYSPQLSAYFRILYNLVELVDQAPLDAPLTYGPRKIEERKSTLI